MTTLLNNLIDDNESEQFGILDEYSKREIRRAILTAVAVPGYQVPFGSREMPVARGWGSGGLQITLAVIGPKDVIKVIDQGDDQGVKRSKPPPTHCAVNKSFRNNNQRQNLRSCKADIEYLKTV